MGMGCSRYSVILPRLIRISLINKTHIRIYSVRLKQKASKELA